MADVGAFFEAVRTGDTGRVREALRQDPGLAGAQSDRGFSAVTTAAYFGHGDVLRTLLEAGPDLTIHESALVGDVPRLEALLAGDPSLLEAYSADGFTPIGLAAYMGHVGALRLLLANGADVNAVGRNEGKFTALTGAVASNHVEVVRILLEHGADARYRYENGSSPLHEAAANGNLDIAKLLLARGADPAARTADGKTPRDLAREKGHAELAALLAP